MNGGHLRTAHYLTETWYIMQHDVSAFANSVF